VSKNRIALVVPSLRGGGLERVVRDLALRLPAEGFVPAVFGITGFGVYEADLRAAGIPLFDSRQPGFRLPGYPKVLLRQLREFGPDLIHAHTGTWLPSAVCKALLPGVPLVYTDHGRYPPEPRGRALIERWCLGRTQRLVAVSAALATYLGRFLGSGARAEVIPNGIDLAKFRQVNLLRREALRAEWRIEPGHILGIAVGRLAPVKNHLGMIRALASAGERAPGLRLAFIGSGPLEAELRTAAAAAGVESRVLFLGFRADVADCLSASDFWLSASSTEGLPLSLLEAMAAGLPIIATSVGGIPETLDGAGLLVPAGEDGALADALGMIAVDGRRREALGRAARERSERYSVEEMTARYVSLYHEALDRRTDR
jgi:glycosyltransferase involved in cell wall biosynthesis